MKSILSYGYVLTLALWVGCIFAVTFVVTPVIFKTFGRDMAGQIVGSIFTVYFPFNLLASIAALILFLLLGPDWGQMRDKFAVGLIALAIVLNLYVFFGLYPQINQIKSTVASFESADMSPQRLAFKRLHAVSAVINLTLLADGAVLLAMCRELVKR